MNEAYCTEFENLAIKDILELFQMNNIIGSIALKIYIHKQFNNGLHMAEKDTQGQ